MSTEEDTRSKLRQVSALFHDHIRLVRSQQLNDKDKLAEDWLKKTRITIMEKLEMQYQIMTRNPDPSEVPIWAIDPRQKLTIWTGRFMSFLEPYKPWFSSELKRLMDDCGFNAEITPFVSLYGFSIEISFPEDHGTGGHSNLQITKQVGKDEVGAQSREKKQRGTADGNGRETMIGRGAGMTLQAKGVALTTEEDSKDADDSEGKLKKPRRTKARRKRGKKVSRL